ncbi:hypothetical protein P3X46_022997 [Hevea brasiliensis]|uniref:Reticulon-like protein n=1 Tax=Hevea brasiliensis TaxID=3981 RepID=A0ABQ9LDA9_HEVBR|nr:reticulon-like protein B14 [Hevea brasiliensis]KAJ9163318.1 hypothetical protein P3X46_022997 [Hevea brasiliensis]
MLRWGIYDSDSDDNQPAPSRKLFSHGRSLHAILGGGHVADILLWKNKYLSAGILTGFTVIWFLLEVVEYHVVTLLCHLLMLFMAILFIWSNTAGFINRNPPDVDDIELPESTLKFFFGQINQLLSNLYYISSGKDLITFFVAIACLWILSALGSLCSTLTLLYIVYLCLATLPVLYERYEDQVDNFVGRSGQEMKNLFEKFNTKVLDKIPRGPTKEKKLA